MKLIVTRDIANVKPLGLDAVALKLVHENHIPKGTRFSIGKSEIFKDLLATEKVIIAELISSRSAIVVNAENDELVKKIDVEVAAEAKRNAPKETAKA